MTIPASASVPSMLAPNLKTPFVDDSGVLNTHGWQVLTNFLNFIQGTNRIVPCNASGTNVITLTMTPTAPLITQYNDFDTFRTVAAGTSTGSVTAKVVTPQGSLATIKVFKTNGSSQAGAGDITSGLLYDFTYVDSLDTGAGGFVLR
jgi:hypothetical protein